MLQALGEMIRRKAKTSLLENGCIDVVSNTSETIVTITSGETVYTFDPDQSNSVSNEYLICGAYYKIFKGIDARMSMSKDLLSIVQNSGNLFRVELNADMTNLGVVAPLKDFIAAIRGTGKYEVDAPNYNLKINAVDISVNDPIVTLLNKVITYG